MKHKKFSFLIIAVALFVSNTYAAIPKGGNWGAGIFLGRPLAITAKNVISEKNAIDMGFGYSWGNSVLFYGDYLFAFPNTFDTESSFINDLIPYVGGGLQLEFYDSDHKRVIHSEGHSTVFSTRFPLGLAWEIPKAPVELYIEAAPILHIAPGLAFDMSAGIGARYYF